LQKELTLYPTKVTISEPCISAHNRLPPLYRRDVLSEARDVLMFAAAAAAAASQNN
jgi:hypothetical protein